MAFEGRALDAITEDDLNQLISDGESEGRVIDYKTALSSGHTWNQEFRRDVTSFANTIGGHIVFGMTETGGVPTGFAPLAVLNPEREILRLHQILQAHVKPRVPGVEMAVLPLAGGAAGGCVMIVAIPRSPVMPQQVAVNQDYEFWQRNSAGKERMDVDNLRAAFMLSDSFAERARRFRSERVAALAGRSLYLHVPAGAALAIHVIPYGAFVAGTTVDVGRFVNNLGPLGNIGGGVTAYRFNLDGFQAYLACPGMAGVVGYVQLYRNGIIEAVDTTLFENDTKVISAALGPWVRDAVRNYLRAERELGVSPPIVVMVSLTAVSGYTFKSPPALARLLVHPIDRDVLAAPEAVVSNYDEAVETPLRPVFDAIWNAADQPGSPYYDSLGNWLP